MEFFRTVNQSFFYNENTILSISDIVLLKQNARLYNFRDLPKTAILSLSRNSISLKKRLFCKRLKGLQGKGYLLGGNLVYCCNFGNGAPAIIGLMEELRFFGVENFIFVGIAGSLDLDLKQPLPFYIKEAYSSSGCSFFYSKHEKVKITLDEWANTYISHLNLKSSVCWSTDAPFRETKSLLSYFKTKGARHVDMETASIYAFAQFYSLNALAIIISGDYFVDLTWHPPSSIREINTELKTIIDKIISVTNG